MKHLDPADLQPHPILATIPAPAKDSEEVCACADAIREQDGLLLPIIIDERNQILTDDSRLRWMAARRMQLTEVPVIVQPGARAAEIALGALIHRAHLTKAAIAYLAFPLLKPALDSARAARAETIKKGQQTSIVHSVHYRGTAEDLAESIGICRRLFFLAKEVRAEFDKDKKKYNFTVEGGDQDGEEVQQTLKEHFEPKLLRQQVDSEHASQRPIGLGGVMKAIGSIRATKGAMKLTNPQLELFTGGFDLVAKRFAYWNDFDAPDKAKAVAKLEEFVEDMPDDLREELVRALQLKTKGRR